MEESARVAHVMDELEKRDNTIADLRKDKESLQVCVHACVCVCAGGGGGGGGGCDVENSNYSGNTFEERTPDLCNGQNNLSQCVQYLEFCAYTVPYVHTHIWHPNSNNIQV